LGDLGNDGRLCWQWLGNESVKPARQSTVFFANLTKKTELSHSDVGVCTDLQLIQWEFWRTYSDDFSDYFHRAGGCPGGFERR
jgi:hypothetical protein